jgi:hypothetical protein
MQNPLNRIPPTWRIPVLVFAVLLIGALLFLYGAKAWNGIGSRFHDWRVSAAKTEIQSAKNEAAESKKVAEGAIAAFEAEKLVTAEERKKRELAESILADKSKNTNQKLAAYEAALAARPTVTGAESTDELCKRAAALGLSVTCK